MISEDLLKHFQKKYIDNAKDSGRARYIGLENEYPVVDSQGNSIPIDVILHLFEELSKNGWDLIRDNHTHQAVGVKRQQSPANRTVSSFADTITTDVGYHTLEISLAPAMSLHEAASNLKQVINNITSILELSASVLLGYGIQPNAEPNSKYVAPKARYHIIESDSLNRVVPETQGKDVHCLALSAASQTHVEVGYPEMISIVNSMNATAGLRIALCANSPVWRGEHSQYSATRELFYDWCFENRRSQTPVPPYFQSVNHYIDYVLDFRALMIKRGDEYYALDSKRPFRHYMMGEYEYSTSLTGEIFMLTPMVQDLNFQCGFAWFDTRLQPAFGTIEDRFSCQQLPQSHFVSNALTLGLVENSEELVQFAKLFALDQWREIRIEACKNGLKARYKDVDLIGLINTMLNIARKGLEKRGMNEIVFLAPLYDRLERKMTPADLVRASFDTRGLSGLVSLCDMRALVIPE